TALKKPSLLYDWKTNFLIAILRYNLSAYPLNMLPTSSFLRQNIMHAANGLNQTHYWASCGVSVGASEETELTVNSLGCLCARGLPFFTKGALLATLVALEAGAAVTIVDVEAGVTATADNTFCAGAAGATAATGADCDDAGIG